MAEVIVKIRIMPESPEVDLEGIYNKANELLKQFANEEIAKKEILPVAFGLKSLDITFVMDESKGDVEPYEKQLQEIEGVQSVETLDVRRAMG